MVLCPLFEGEEKKLRSFSFLVAKSGVFDYFDQRIQVGF
jgi:hypothetical protein